MFPGVVVRDVNSIVGAVYSMSYSAKPLFGDAASAFEAALAEALLRLEPTGVFNEHIETEVVIARKKSR